LILPDIHLSLVTLYPNSGLEGDMTITCTAG
jgi:hypothetical protein